MAGTLHCRDSRRARKTRLRLKHSSLNRLESLPFRLRHTGGGKSKSPLPLPEWSRLFGGSAARLSESNWSSPESSEERRFPRQRAEALGSLSFGSVFFGDSKKMNPAGGPEPAGIDLNFDFLKLQQKRENKTMSAKKIMIIDNEEGLCRMMEAVLMDDGHAVRSFTNPLEAVEVFRPGIWDLVISDIKMPGIDGLEVLQRIKATEADIPVIMITAFATVEMSIQALRRGAYDMLTKPFEPDELLFRVRNALSHNDLQNENKQLREELAGKFNFDNIIGASMALQKLLDKVEKVAIRDTSVLITGESGTGKELIAQAIHYNSPRREKPFIAINCGAIPDSVLESELFGHKKGSFTGAESDKEGLLKAADGGTLFLDEIGNLPLNVQKTLLRFLQEQEFRRIGDTESTRVDVRLISATNADLTADVETGEFREDLFYRLNVINLHLPPLRERRADIPLLATHFIAEQNKKFNTSIKGLSAEAQRAASEYSWPGNIRQLRNVIEACMTIESTEQIDLSTLAQFIETEDTPSEEDDYNQALGRFEIDYLHQLLRSVDGNIEEAAQKAGMNMATIYRKLKKYGLRKQDVLD